MSNQARDDVHNRPLVEIVCQSPPQTLSASSFLLLTGLELVIRRWWFCLFVGNISQTSTVSELACARLRQIGRFPELIEFIKFVLIDINAKISFTKKREVHCYPASRPQWSRLFSQIQPHRRMPTSCMGFYAPPLARIPPAAHDICTICGVSWSKMVQTPA